MYLGMSSTILDCLIAVLLSLLQLLVGMCERFRCYAWFFHFSASQPGGRLVASLSPYYMKGMPITCHQAKVAQDATFCI
jgi:hypothetical protein